jgi:hypothetical protein
MVTLLLLLLLLPPLMCCLQRAGAVPKPVTSSQNFSCAMNAGDEGFGGQGRAWRLKD